MTDKTFFESTGNTHGPVECLGMSFENDQARREYFLEKLSEKLKDPGFRQISGFPTGEDDDILAMSDPPYYTACPNPFLGSAVEQLQNNRPDYYRIPFTFDVSEGKTDQLYRAHGYHTKVPHKAIMRYILHYTDPGDLIFDGFCGSGMMGVAAQLCGNREEVLGLGYHISNDGTLSQPPGYEVGSLTDTNTLRLGPRNAILCELSPAATFIAMNLASPVEFKRFKAEASRILSELDDEFGWMYATTDSDGEQVRFNYTVWSDVFSCGDCGNDIVFLREALDTTTGNVRDSFPCPHCGAVCEKNKIELRYETVMDAGVGNPVTLPMRIPVLVNYRKGRQQFEKSPDDSDLATLKEIANVPFPVLAPTFELPDMQMRRVGRMKPAAITHAHHFFLPRALHVMTALWEKARAISDRRMRHAILFFIDHSFAGQSLLNRYKPVMHGKYGGSQVNNGLSGVFYVASQIAECSPWYSLEGRLKRLTKVFEKYQPVPGRCWTTTQDLAACAIPDDSIDYVFTDPPFGENIYYSDLNILVESWHGVLTSPEKEAIIDRVKGKTLLDYQRMMSDCFSNYYRVLKPGRWMTVEFHNSQNRVWNSIQEALQHAGFVVADVRMLDKKQGSFQQVVSGNTVKRDLIISAYKPNGGLEERFMVSAGKVVGVWEFVSNHLKQLPVFVAKEDRVEPVSERQRHLLFDRMVAFHVQRGVSVPLSAAEFHAALDEKYPERDGMYFLPDQVAVYEKKRMSVKEVVQLELFVSNERSAIEWLRQQLTRKPQTYQEIAPKFMKELAGWEKHEKHLELLELLTHNFFCYDDGGTVPARILKYIKKNHPALRALDASDAKVISKAKNCWYVPDPKDEADLERSRNKALLREFESYLEATGKLKVVRSEALLAGFGDCWKKDDYQTIVNVAKRVKEEIIQENDKLLMYYDNAMMLSGE